MKNWGTKISFGFKKLFEPKKILGLKKVFWQKVFGSKNIYGSEKCLNPKEYWVQKILGLKDFMIKIKSGPINVWSQKYLKKF